MAEFAPDEYVSHDSHATVRSRMVRAPRVREYEVALVEDLLGSGRHVLIDRIGRRPALIVTTPTVARLYARSIHAMLSEHNAATSMMVLACEESSKVPEQVVRVCDRAIEIELGRDGLLIGIGGGVCTDIVTVAASWIRRGIEYIRIPTTLVGQIDAGIGIKGAVNFGGKKNYLGCFYPPSAVYADPAFLETLSPRHIRCGLAEIMKIGLVRDVRLLDIIERHWCALDTRRFDIPRRIVNETVWRSILGLLNELEPNLHEDQSLERLADFGHTFSPALESASSFAIHHGEAVAIDMALSAALSVRLGMLDPGERDRILDTLVALRLPVWHELLDVELCRRALAEAALHRGGSPNLVLPLAIGESEFIRRLDRISAADLASAVAVVRGFAGREATGR